MERQFLEKLIKGVKFHFRKQEQYSLDEVFKLEEDLKKAILSDISESITDKFKQTEDKVIDLSEQLKMVNDKKTEFENGKSALENQLKEFEQKISEREAIINKYEREEKKRFSKDLFGGLVANGAETDVMEWLGDSVKKVSKDFTDDMDIEDKRELVKPFVEALIETRPYLRPETKSFKSDNKSLVTKKKTVTEEKEDEDRYDYNSSHQNFGYEG